MRTFHGLPLSYVRFLRFGLLIATAGVNSHAGACYPIRRVTQTLIIVNKRHDPAIKLKAAARNGHDLHDSFTMSTQVVTGGLKSAMGQPSTSS
ncbi:hypothetical protein SARC_13860, partial [Sphaeroforma arctica JP610]